MKTNILNRYMPIVMVLCFKCNCGSITVLELADGGKSHPIKIVPFSHDHDNEKEKVPEEIIPKAEALSATKTDSPENITKRDTDEEIGLSEETKITHPDESVESFPEGILFDKSENTTEPHVQNSTTLPPTVKTTHSVTTEKATTTVITEKATILTTTTQRTMSTPSTTESSQKMLPCHEKCLKALNATVLDTMKNKTLLSQGNNLTLTCELPLDSSSFILEDLIWLYHPKNTPTHQCSLTPKKFLTSCQGFLIIKDTDDRNSTFCRETISLANMQANYSGQYMCQIKVTCCPSESSEHVMNQEHIVDIEVIVWYADYVFDLALAGSITGVLAIILIVGTFCLTKKQRASYTFITDNIQEIKPCTVLHIPLVEDNDNDSFDSASEEND